MLMETSSLTTICQNEEKLNAACGPVTRKTMHDSSSRDAIASKDVEDYSANKERIYPTRSEENVNSFTGTGLVYRIRSLLECERRLFNDKTEETFSQSNSEFKMKLKDREKAMLVLDPRICWSKKVLNDVARRKHCNSELKTHHIECCVQTKSDERCKSDNKINE